MKKATKKEILEIHRRFIERYDEAVTELAYTNAYELVVAVALSAQCTDKRVNLITPALFKKYPSTKELANADINEVKALINSCSFFNNKATNIIKMAQIMLLLLFTQKMQRRCFLRYMRQNRAQLIQIVLPGLMLAMTI